MAPIRVTGMSSPSLVDLLRRLLSHLSIDELCDLLSTQDDEGDTLLMLTIIEREARAALLLINSTVPVGLLSVRNDNGQDA